MAATRRYRSRRCRRWGRGSQRSARLGSERLYLTVPFVLAGILRYLQITLVEERSGSPTAIVLTDRFMIATIIGWIATFAALIYG